MSLSVVPLVDEADREARAADAAYLRALADRVEAGEVSEAVVVFNDRVAAGFVTWGRFEDRWRLLGALEYAKQAALAG